MFGSNVSVVKNSAGSPLKMSPSITLYDLSMSRSIRIAWLLEELELPYTIIHAERDPSNGLSEESFKRQTGTMLGKAPVLKDGDLLN